MPYRLFFSVCYFCDFLPFPSPFELFCFCFFHLVFSSIYIDRSIRSRGRGRTPPPPERAWHAAFRRHHRQRNLVLLTAASMFSL